MKVKIKKLKRSDVWYASFIGAVFEVCDKEYDMYRLINNGPLIIYNGTERRQNTNGLGIHKEDAEIVMFEPENGMVFEDKNGRHGIFIAINGAIGALYRNIDGVFSTYDCEDSIRINLKTGYYKKIWKATSIYDLTRSGIDALTGRDPVWQYTLPIKELTLQEVADKFGIPVEQLRIKD